MIKELKKGDLVKIILKAILVSGVVVSVVVLPGTSILLKYLVNDDKNDNKRFKKALWDLEKQKYIMKNGHGQSATVRLTKKGKRKALEYDYDNLKLKKPTKWDGLWRMVIFDIPEKQKNARSAINFKLKDIGFIPIQKSTFIYPYEAKKEIDFIRNFLFVRKHVNYIVIKSLENSHEFKKLFNLG